jgi:hypothetical protein
MCCNTPCESLAVSTVSLPDLCYWAGHAHVDQCGPQGRSLLGGGHRFCLSFDYIRLRYRTKNEILHSCAVCLGLLKIYRRLATDYLDKR